MIEDFIHNTKPTVCVCCSRLIILSNIEIQVSHFLDVAAAYGGTELALKNKIKPKNYLQKCVSMKGQECLQPPKQMLQWTFRMNSL